MSNPAEMINKNYADLLSKCESFLAEMRKSLAVDNPDPNNYREINICIKNLLTFRVGLRHFRVIPEIFPLTNPFLVLKTFEENRNVTPHTKIEIEGMRMTHHLNDHNGGKQISLSELMSYAHRLDKEIYKINSGDHDTVLTSHSPHQ